MKLYSLHTVTLEVSVQCQLPCSTYCQFLISIQGFFFLSLLCCISLVTNGKLINPQIYGTHLENEEDTEIVVGMPGTSMMILSRSLLSD